MRLKLLALSILLSLSAYAAADTYHEPVKPRKVHIVKVSKIRLFTPSLNANDDEVEVCDDDDYIVQTHQSLKVKKPATVSKEIAERLALIRLLVLTRLAYPIIN